MHNRTAYLPLATYPDAVADESVLAAVEFANVLDCALHVTSFAVNIPRISSPFGDMLVDVPNLVKAAEEKSRAECRRRLALVKAAAGKRFKIEGVTKEIVLGAANDTAAYEARYYDVAVLPWAKDTVAAQEVAQAVVFGSGRPTVLVAPKAKFEPLEHLAIAWDGSRVSARALWDALSFLRKGGRVSVFTVRDEKPLSGPNIAQTLVAHLEKRGIAALAFDIRLQGRGIADALQEETISKGAHVLAMGGFGHSRVRDFLLGGATKGVLADLRIPVLLSH